MKNKLAKGILFIFSTIFLSTTGLAERTSSGLEIGDTPEERAAIVARIDRNTKCSQMDLDENMTVKEFIATCVNGILSIDGCTLSVESACLNGEDVPLMAYGASKRVLEKNGFNTRLSNGVDGSDFKDQSTMYNDIDLPNGKKSKLCSQVPSIDRGAVSAGLREERLPDGYYEVGSTPAVLKPGKDMGGMSLHWRIIVAGSSRTVELQLRDIDQIDQSINSLGRASAFKTTDTDFIGALGKLLFSNFVRCKKIETTNSEHPIATTPIDYSDKDKESILAAQKSLLGANSGINSPDLRSRLTNLLGVPNDMAEAPNAKINRSRLRP